MPKAELQPLRQIAETVWTARRGAQRMTVFRLADETLALYSPVAGLTPAFRESLDAVGRVSAILAPSHFHHLGIAEHAEAFSVSLVVAPDVAIRRLVRQTGMSFSPLATIEVQLLTGFAFHVTQGARAGEAWLRFPHADGIGWAVCDAFGAKAAPDEPRVSEPLIRGSFAMMCLPKGAERRQDYVAWAQARIKADRPTRLLPCHGAMVASPDLPAALDRLLETL